MLAAEDAETPKPKAVEKLSVDDACIGMLLGLTGKKTIAEFAENEEIITMLRGMGIDYAQGYGVSEPKRVTRAVA